MMSEQKNSSEYTFFNVPDDDIHVSFGSLLSTSKFIVHSIDLPFDDTPRWTMVLDQKTCRIKCQSGSAVTVRFTLLMKQIGTQIFVVETSTHTNIIMNMNNSIEEVQIIKNTGSSKLYGDDPLIMSLRRCSEIVIRIASKAVADEFLNYLRHGCKYDIFYTNISIEQSSCKSWDAIEFNWYPTIDATYSMAMLHSLGYLFDDKYLMNDQLQGRMVELSEENEERFYQLAVQAF
ncbi:unnamed protein product, partial [Adineta ricciae]